MSDRSWLVPAPLGRRTLPPAPDTLDPGAAVANSDWNAASLGTTRARFESAACQSNRPLAICRTVLTRCWASFW